MRKFIPYLFLGLACFLWPSWSTGQTNVVIGDTAGASSYFYGPLYRSSSTSSFNYSFYGAIYEAADLAVPIGTTINSISWKKQSAFTITGGLANFTIRMRNSTASSFVGTQRYDTLTSAGYTTVYSSTTQDITGAANTWVTFTFTTPFVYNGGSLIVSTDWNRDGGTSNGALNWYYETKTGKAVGYASSSAPTASSTTSSSYSDRRPAVRLNVTYPAGACFPPSNLMVSATTATTGSASWTSGGAANSLVEYGPSGFTLGTGTKMYVSTTSASLTSLSPNTTYDVYVKDSCTTNASPFIGPMSFTTPCATVMSGTYTINSGMPTGGTNFNSFSEAASELSVCGIGGPVTINVVQGTYSEQFAISSIPGASSTNTVVIQPAAANTMPVEVTYAASGSSDNYVMQLNGASHLTVKGITLTPTGASNGRAIELYGACSHVTIEDNILNGVPSTTTSNFMAVIYNGTATVDTISNMTIRGNTITNGSYGVYIYGTSSAYAMNNTIDSNMITDFYYFGVYSYYQENLNINGNTIVQNSTTPYSTGYGIYNYYGDFSSVVGNTIKLYATGTNYGIYNYFCDASAASPNLIANNMVSCAGNTGTTYGIYPYNNYYTDIVFNSINVTGGSTTAGRGIYINSSTTGTYGFVNLKNNNVVNSGGGYAFEVSSGAVTLGYVASSDYNNLYATGSTLARVNNSNYADLAAYQLAVPTFDQNSVSDFPLFVAPDDLHASSPTLNGAGSPYAGVDKDIDGETRSVTTPDIGADEFAPPSCLPSSGLTLVTAYADSAVVAWRPGTGTTYILEFDTTGFTQGLGTTITGIVDTFYTITGLNSSSGYDFYIQNDCGASGLSPWAGPVSFNTLIAGPRNISCGPGTLLDTIFTEEFDNSTSFTGDIGAGNGSWLFDNNTTGSGSTGPSGPHSGTHYIFAETSTGGPDTMRMVSPAIDLSTAMTAAEMSFWLHAYGASIGVLNVGVSTSATGPFATQFSFGPGQLQTDELDPYQNVGVNLDAFLGQTIYVQFEYIRGSTFTGDLAIDLVEVMTCVDPCTIIAAPYTESFDGSSTPACWSQSATTGGPWAFSTGSGVNTVTCSGPSDHTGNSGRFAWMDHSGGDAGVILEMPMINVSALTVPYLEMYYWMCGVGYTPINPLYIETFDGTNWTVFDSIVQGTSGWELFGFDLSTAVYNTNKVKVRFRTESGGSGSDFYGDPVIDDVSIIEAPSCIPPSSLGATNVGTTTADLFWSTGGAANWNVEYGSVGFALGSGTRMAVTNDTLALTGLSASSTYDFYVQDSCGVGDVSSWSGPYTFVTLCGVIVPPSLEDFNNGFPPNCWEQADGGTPSTAVGTLGTSAWGDDGFGNVGTSGAARINLWNLGDEDWILSPFYDLTGGPWSAEFDFGVYLYANTGVGTLGSDDQVQFLISLDTGATWTMLALFDSSYVTAPGGNHESISLAAYAGNTVMFAVWATEGAVDDPEDNDIFFDNFAVVDPCAVITAPYLETFDVNSTPNCWSQSATTGGPWAFSTGSGVNTVTCSGPSDHTGNSGYFAWMDHSGGDAGVILEMPMINVSALTVPYLDFYYWMCGVGYTPINPLYIETFDGTNWTVFDSIVQGTAGWEEFGYDLTTAIYNTDKVKVRFRTESGGSTSDFYGDPVLDDVSIVEAPSCIAPTTLGVTNVSTTSADLFWTTGGATNWNVQHGPAGFTLGTGTMTNSTNDTLSIGGLSAATSYEFYVRDSCAVGDVSVWVGPFAFNTTVCPPANACTYMAELRDTYGDAWNGGEVTVWQGGVAVQVLTYPVINGGQNDTLLVVPIQLCDNLNTVVTISALGSFSSEIGVRLIDPLSSIAGNHTAVGGLGTGDTLFMFTSSCVQPACPNPTALGSFNITQNSADVYWTKGSTGATSIVEFGPTGFTPGTGTQVIATNDTITLTGLTASTAYDFCVTDSCGVGNVSLSFCASFTTSCAVFVAPFLETFDGTSTPICWSETAVSGGPWLYGGAGTNSVNCSPANDHTGNNGNYAWMDQSGTDVGVVLQTPVVDVASITTPYLDFFYWMCGAGFAPDNKTYLEYWSGANWVVFDSIVDSTLGWEYHAYPLTGKTYSTNLVQLRFRAESGGSASDFFGDNAIDDVFIGEKRICQDPTGLVITGTSLNSATLAWNSDTNITASLIEYGPTGFVLGTGIQVPAGPGGGVVANLTSSTCYDFYIADSCGTSLLAWVGPVNGCTAAPCTVTTTPTNVMGDTTACGGGLVNLTATTTGNVAWMTGGEVVGTGSPFTPDSIFFTTNYTAYDYVASGPSVHVGPLPSIAATGFGNFSNGQWISVQDTITIDSTTVRANGYVNAQVWILDPAQTRVIQRGEVFETDSNVTANYQVPVGIVLTPGVYYMAIDFDITAVSLGALFRATGGAAYPYAAAGLMSIDSVNFAGARYYYTFDLVIKGACLGAAATPMAVGYVPGANAGASDSVAVCATNSAVNLASYLGVHDPGGTWSDDNSTGALTGGIFDATAVVAGTYNFTYHLAALGGCAPDSATIEVTVVAGGTAGADSTVVVCVSGPSIQLRNYLTGSTGGIWTNLDNASGVIGGSLLTPGTAGVGTYRFRYRLLAGVCPADTAIITVVIDPAANAGASTSDTVCDTLNAIDLTTYLDANAVVGGTWKDVNGSGGLTGSTFNATAVISGSAYVLRYVVDNGCGQDSADITLFVGCNISLNEFGIATLEVYPNPTSGVVNIRSINAGSQSVTIELYSTSGQLLMSKTADLDGELPIDISKFADGVYNLKITTDEGTEVHRISKM